MRPTAPQWGCQRNPKSKYTCTLVLLIIRASVWDQHGAQMGKDGAKMGPRWALALLAHLLARCARASFRPNGHGCLPVRQVQGHIGHMSAYDNAEHIG